MVHKVAFVVPTMDRPDDLRGMLSSLAAQTRPPDQIIIVDGSKTPVDYVLDEIEGLNIEYVRVFPPSLAAQRNAGIARIGKEITLAGYLDDDLVIEPDAMERMVAYWDSALADLGGAVFNITNTQAPRWMRVKALFGIDSVTPGRVLRSGCTSILGYQDGDIETDWLCGGATLWRREIVENYPYDEWFVGTGYLEDVEYSFRVGEHYQLALVANARLVHNSPPIRADKYFLLGKWQVINRMYFVNKYRKRGLSLIRAWWATFGMILINSMSALLKRDINSLNRARGNIAGAFMELTGRREQMGGFLK